VCFALLVLLYRSCSVLAPSVFYAHDIGSVETLAGYLWVKVLGCLTFEVLSDYLLITQRQR